MTPSIPEIPIDVDDKLLALVVRFSEDSIIITDTELNSPGPRIIYVNPGFTRMTGYQPVEVLGKTPRILQGPKTDRDVLKKIRIALQEGRVFSGQAINYRKDGTEFWNEWHIEAIKNNNGTITHYMAIQRDITKRKEIEQTIVQKNLALKEILEQIEIEKDRIKENVQLNVEMILLPALKKLRKKSSGPTKGYIDILEKNLLDLTGTFGRHASEKRFNLSPREAEIANLIKSGLSSKEIAEMIHISFKTVETHRNRIRKKLNILKKDINLTTYLQSI
jgi:PAS domain S-box-containing protein